MKIDLYTRAVLTVIAACLVWLCVNSLTPSASAQAPAQDIQRVIIVGAERALPVTIDHPQPVTIVDNKGTPLIGAAGLHVNLGAQVVPVSYATPESALPVVIRSIARAGKDPWQPIPVDVQKTPPTQFPGP